MKTIVLVLPLLALNLSVTAQQPSQPSACDNEGFESMPTGSYVYTSNIQGWTIKGSSRVPSCAPPSWFNYSSEFALVTTPVTNVTTASITIPHSPLGGTVVACLNNTSPNNNTTRLLKTIPVTASNCFFNYAISGVMDDIFHDCCDDPLITIRFLDVNNQEITCLSHTYAPTSCTWVPTAPMQTIGAIAYLPWQTESASLLSFIGSTITVEVTAYDCAYGGHSCSAYFDATCASSSPILFNSTFCIGSSSASIAGPSGMTGYTWTAPSPATISAAQASLSSISIQNPTLGMTYTVAMTATNGCTQTYLVPLTSSSVNIGPVTVRASCNYTSNGSATVQALGSSIGYSYTWSGSSGNFTNTTGISNTLSPGSYTISVFAQGCGTRTTAITVPTISSAFTLQPAPQLTICNNAQQNITPVMASNSLISSYTFSWTSSPQLIPQSNYASITGSAPSGSTQLSIFNVTVNPSGFNCPSVASFSILSINPPTPTVSVPQSICSNVLPVTVTVSPPGGAYSLAQGIINQGGQFNPALLPPGSNTVTYVYSQSGCVSVSMSTFTIFTAPQLSLNGPAAVCSGEAATLSATADQPVSYMWGQSPGSNTFAVTPVTTQVYTVSGTNASTGCSGKATFTLIADPVPALSVAGPTAMCLGASDQLTGSGADSYTWSPSFGFQSLSISPTVTTTYTLNGEYTQTGCRSSITHTVSVYSYPTLTVSGNHLLCAGETLTLSAAGADTYSWSNASTNAQTTVQPASNISFTLTGTNQGLCSAKQVISVLVTACTGVDESRMFASVYPVPADDEMFIESSSAGSYLIHDISGRQLMAGELVPGKNRIDLSSLAAGAYHLTVSAGLTTITRKVIIQ